MEIKRLDIQIPELCSKSNTDPLEERELAVLMEHAPKIALLIQQGFIQRTVDHAGKYFLLILHEPIE